jgi:hypothetical protein
MIHETHKIIFKTSPHTQNFCHQPHSSDNIPANICLTGEALQWEWQCSHYQYVRYMFWPCSVTIRPYTYFTNYYYHKYTMTEQGWNTSCGVPCTVCDLNKVNVQHSSLCSNGTILHVYHICNSRFIFPITKHPEQQGLFGLLYDQGPDFDDMSSFFLYVVNVAFKY